MENYPNSASHNSLLLTNLGYSKRGVYNLITTNSQKNLRNSPMRRVEVSVNEKQPEGTSPWALTSKCLSLQKHNLMPKIGTSVLHWQVTPGNFFLYCCYSHNPVLKQTMISCLQRNFRFLLGLAMAWLCAGSLLRMQQHKISYSPYKNSHLNMIKLRNPTFKIPTHSTKTMQSSTSLTSAYKTSNNQALCSAQNLTTVIATFKRIAHRWMTKSL